MARRPNTRTGYKYGICLNKEKEDGTPCSLYINKVKQKIPARKEMLCEECGSPLREVPPPTPITKYIIAAVAAITVIGAGTGIGFYLKNNQADMPKGGEPGLVDTIIPVNPEPKRPVEPKVINPEFGKYDGPRNAAGKAHGLGGSLKVTKNYSLDLKDGKHTVVQLNPGDVIANTKFIDGKLVQGQLKRTDGTQKYLSIGN